ncbi:MAG: 1-acyl-sn-glycerol-3-phosphate acyltransferase [Ruminococcus sp.]|nr:1-acyl-sn-glycerol-3-phosphate acyltransferase [Ruminococcus sp.]
MNKKNKKKKWLKFRHRIVRNLAFIILKPYCKIKYGITIEPIKDKRKRPYLIVMNHQTAFDQFFLGMAFPGAVYYIASEDIFSNGFISRLIDYLVAPIPIKKQTTDVHAILNCMRIAREGGTIALAPEGNRTYSGETVYINPAVSKLAKKLMLPLAFFRIEGGFGVHPRWSDVVRKGKMRGYVSRIVEPEELKAMSDDELYELIKQELYVNEGTSGGIFRHKKAAQYLERAMYVCPWCGLSEFESSGDTIECKQCHRKIRYMPTKELQGIDCEFPHKFLTQWYNYQCDYINNLNTAKHTDTPLYKDTADISLVTLYKNKTLLTKGAELSLYGDKIKIHSNNELLMNIPFDSTRSTVVILGKNKLNIYFDGKVYQIKGDKRFNGLKYLNIYHRHINLKEGNPDVKFLGL